MLSGRHPENGRPLVVRPGTVAGYDLTFAAPKSVSVLLALAGPDAVAAVEAAHDVAVDRALGYVDRRAMAVRRGDADERVVVPTDGAIGAAFTHRVSRALDPHLHTHVVVANVARGPDGRWTGIDSRGLFAHAGRGRPALRRRAPARVVDGARGVVVGRRGRPLRGGRHR